MSILQHHTSHLGTSVIYTLRDGYEHPRVFVANAIPENGGFLVELYDTGHIDIPPQTVFINATSALAACAMGCESILESQYDFDWE